jgi:CubicO group peptidase (beta-lactamase class C family)
MRKNILLILMILCTVSFLQAQTKAEQISDVIEYYYDSGVLNGSILVAEKGEIVYHEALGASNINQDKLTTDHNFRLASVSKTFTSIAILMLLEEGGLKLEDKVSSHLLDFPYNEITIKHLLTHTSGLPSYPALLDQYWDTANADRPSRMIASNKSAYKLLLEHEPLVLFQPGDEYRYSNTGYMLLALIVEEISGISFQKFMQENFFDPLEMTSTYVNSPDGNNPTEMRAFSLKQDLLTGDYISGDFHYQNGMYGDGGIFSTTGDLFKFDRALKEGKLISTETLGQVYEQHPLNDGSTHEHGYSWSVLDMEEGPLAVHGGGWLDYSTWFARDLDNDLTIIQLCNRNWRHRAELIFTIYDILQGQEFELLPKQVHIPILREIGQNDINTAFELYHRLKTQEMGNYDFSENTLNMIGYYLVNRKMLPEALQVFQLNVEEYPESWNVYDSLAEAYMLIGDKENAINNYNESLMLNTENENAREKLKNLLIGN